VIRVQAKPIHEYSEQIGNLGTRRATVGMKFIDNQMKEVPIIRREPASRMVENRSLNISHQHDIEHAVVGDEDIRRMILHIPTRPHLPAT
jgi:hypothetical protein